MQNSRLLWLLVSCLIFIHVSSICAQNSRSNKSNLTSQNDGFGEAWFSMIYGLAQNDFADDVKTPWGVGGSFGLLFNTSKSSDRLKLGVEFSVLYMGKDKTNIEDIPIKTTNTLMTSHIVTRYSPPSKSVIRPFIDLLIGGKFIYTETKYDNTALETIFGAEIEDIFAERNVGAWSYGAGVGFSVRKPIAGIDFRLSYVRGPSIDYTQPDNLITEDDGTFYFESTTVGSTDMIFIHLGFSGVLSTY